MKTVCIIGGGLAYATMFQNRGWDVVRHPKSADLLQFTGGSDVHPKFYGELSHPTAHSDMARDRHEHDIFTDFVGCKPMTGICRGGQFLNVMNGGRLYQDVDNHGIFDTHGILIGSPDADHHKVIQVTSTHHQMMRATKDGLVLAYAHESDRLEHMPRTHHDPIIYDVDGTHDDVEVVLYKDTNCLCFQPHPEFDRAPKECTDYYFELILCYHIDLVMGQTIA